MSFYRASCCCYVDVDIDSAPKFLVPQMHVILDYNNMTLYVMSHQSLSLYV